MLRYVMLRYDVMLCHAMLCHAILEIAAEEVSSLPGYIMITVPKQLPPNCYALVEAMCADVTRSPPSSVGRAQGF